MPRATEPRAWGARERATSLAIVLAAVAAAHAAWPDPRARAEALYLGITTLGYGHLIGAAWLARRPALPSPAGVDVRLWRALLLVSIATGLAAYGAILHAEPRMVLVAFVVSAWHIVENDLALGARRPGGGLPPVALATRPGRAALAGTLGIAALGASTPEIAAFTPAFALALPAPSLDGLFAVVTGYHLVAWIRISVRRGRIGPLLAVHALPVALAGAVLALGPSGEALRHALFGPALYLYWSVLHVVQTGLARRVAAPRVFRPAWSRWDLLHEAKPREAHHASETTARRVAGPRAGPPGLPAGQPAARGAGGRRPDPRRSVDPGRIRPGERDRGEPAPASGRALDRHAARYA